MSLAVLAALSRFRAMVFSLAIFSSVLFFSYLVRVAAGLSGEMPRRFREGWGCRFPWFWGGFRCSDGLFSGSAGGPGFPRRRGVFTHAARCLGAVPPGLLSGRRRLAAFLPFLPGVFRSVGERRRARARRKITGPAKNGSVQEKCEGGLQLRVVGSAGVTLCNERLFRTDVSFCGFGSYGSARASVQENCPGVFEGGTGGVLV